MRNYNVFRVHVDLLIEGMSVIVDGAVCTAREEFDQAMTYLSFALMT